MTHTQLMDNVSSSELTMWRAYFLTHPFTWDLSNILNANNMALQTSLATRQSKSDPIAQPSEFYLKFDNEVTKVSQEELITKLGTLKSAIASSKR